MEPRTLGLAVRAVARVRGRLSPSHAPRLRAPRSSASARCRCVAASCSLSPSAPQPIRLGGQLALVSLQLLLAPLGRLFILLALGRRCRLGVARLLLGRLRLPPRLLALLSLGLFALSPRHGNRQQCARRAGGVIATDLLPSARGLGGGVGEVGQQQLHALRAPVPRSSGV